MDNIVFYKGPVHGKSTHMPGPLPSVIQVPAQVSVAAQCVGAPQFAALRYVRTPHTLSGGRRIYRFEP